MSRALIRGAVCQSCRNDTLRSIIAVTGVPMPRYTNALRPSFNSRAFSAIGLSRSDRPPFSNPADVQSSSVEETTLESENNVTTTTAAPVPWYLRDEPETTAQSKPVPGDHIPKLPENSPEMLPILLEYSYKDLGLDQLKLFDLRELDIPAALGANVIMIIGTARSVKHLNVSADRLCRWLRSQYKLSPHADGLLGRNELKIKLRRKAKRARAASHAGTMIDEKDDGITTGWICVNAGVVDKSSSTTSVREAGFEGFGQLETGTSVVVQIFTEEKREEVDMEKLWQGTLDRAERSRLEESYAPAPSSRSTTSPFQGSQRRGIYTACQPMQSKITAGLKSVFPNTMQAPGVESSTESLLQLMAALPRENYTGYSKEIIFSSFKKLLDRGTDISDDLGFDIVASLLAPRSGQYLPQSDIELALQVLERLSFRGVPILNFKMFNLLYQVADTPMTPPKTTEESTKTAQKWTPSQRQILTRLSKIVAAADVPFNEVEARKLMFTQFRCEDYDGFWRLWRQLPLKGASRTYDDYAQLFQLHAELGEERRVRDCLSIWVPMMARETNPIALEGPLVSSVVRCLLIADPAIRNRAEDGSPSYFLDMWTRCQQAL
ncbi:ATPase synthesis protein 25 [Penicillium taxi]|uniref:ATPase synthesis protein 25 n=1 Tax=Penicillium taxi TaxID=168475 RepID=UPI00254598AA|nr:ATPase synthesis protein 25 [Penicillium taxi]KAJ5894698.1 ATPase synthesis protein 25 [Penicillium taxi]